MPDTPTIAAPCRQRPRQGLPRLPPALGCVAHARCRVVSSEERGNHFVASDRAPTRRSWAPLPLPRLDQTARRMEQSKGCEQSSEVDAALPGSGNDSEPKSVERLPLPLRDPQKLMRENPMP